MKNCVVSRFLVSRVLVLPWYLSFEMSTHVDYSCIFLSNVGSFKAKKLIETSWWRFGRLFLYFFWCSSMIISAGTHSWRDTMLLKEFVNIWLLVINTSSIFLLKERKRICKNAFGCFAPFYAYFIPVYFVPMYIWGNGNVNCWLRLWIREWKGIIFEFTK